MCWKLRAGFSQLHAVTSFPQHLLAVNSLQHCTWAKVYKDGGDKVLSLKSLSSAHDLLWEILPDQNTHTSSSSNSESPYTRPSLNAVDLIFSFLLHFKILFHHLLMRYRHTALKTTLRLDRYLRFCSQCFLDPHGMWCEQILDLSWGVRRPDP